MAEPHRCAVCKADEGVKIHRVRLCKEHAEVLVQGRRSERKVTPEHLRRVRELRDEGLTIRQIARKLGLNYETLRKRVYYPYKNVPYRYE